MIPDCPFPGLLPFQEHDAPFFFGRDEETAELLHRLQRSRFIAVIGVSGSGKSSLVRAGLRPELRIAEPPWRIVEIKPGGGPRQHLQRALESVLPGVGWNELLGKSSYGLVDGIGAAGLQPEEKLLVIVDQFEEIFSYRRRGSREAEEADLFVQQLLRAGAEPGVPAYVMLTMRTDYLGHCALFRGLPEALNQGTYLVPRLTRQQQEEAITAPLAVSGVDIEPSVVDQLLNSAEANRDELPVLQHLLKRLWEEWAARGGSGTIDAAESEQTGSWSNAIDLDAESVFTSLDAAAQDAVALVFKRITEKGAGERPIRTPCSFDELTRLVGNHPTPDQLRDAIRRFRSRDLLTWHDETNPGDERIDIPHECVTWRWNRLATWIEEEDRDARRLAFIAESARSGTPLAGSALNEALALRGRITDAWVGRYKLTAAALTDWIDHSQHEATRARKRARHAMIALALATVLFAALGVWALQQRQQAERSARNAQSEAARAAVAEGQAVEAAMAAGAAEREAQKQAAAAKASGDRAEAQTELAEEQRAAALTSAAEGRARLASLLGERSQTALAADPELGLLLGLEAGYATASQGEPLVPGAERALRRALVESGGAILRVPDGQYIRRLGNDDSPVAISPDRRWVAAMGEFSSDRSNGVRLSRVNSQTLNSEVLRGARPPAVFTMDSRWLATAADGEGILLWSLGAGKVAPTPLRLPTTAAVDVLAVSPDGKWLVSAPAVRLWDVSKPELDRQPIAIAESGCAPAGEQPDASLVRISPDSRWLVTGGWHTAVGRLAPPPWPTCLTDLKAREPATSTKVLAGHTRSVTHVVFATDGRRMATYSREGGSRLYVKTDDTVRVWNLAVPAPAESAVQFPVAQNDDARSIDGRLILAKTDQGSRLWDFGVDPPLSMDVKDLEGGPVALGPADNQGERWLLTAGRNDEVLVWKLAPPGNGATAWSLERQEQPLAKATRFFVSADHGTVAMGGPDGSVLLVDLEHYDDRYRRLRRFRGAGSRLDHIDVTGGSLVVVQEDTARIWDLLLDNGAADPITVTGGRPLIAGKRLVAGIDDALTVWDLSAPTPGATVLPGTGPRVEPFAASRDGRRLVSRDGDGRLRLWRLDSANQPGRLLWSPTTPDERQWGYPDVAVSPDGRWVAAAFGDGSVRLWDTASDSAAVRKEHTESTPDVQFSEDSRWLLTTDRGGKSCLWRPGPGTQSSSCMDRVASARLVGSAPWLIAADDNRLRLWDLGNGEPWANPLVIETGLQKMNGFAADPAGRWIAAYGESLVVWRRAPGSPARAATRLDGVKDVLGVHVSRDGRWLATGGGWSPILVWDLLTPVPRRFQFALGKQEVEPWGSLLALYHPPGGNTLLTAAYTEDGFSVISGFADAASFASDQARSWQELRNGVRVSYSALPGVSPDSTKTITADGRWLINFSLGTATLFRLRRPELETLACGTAGRNLTETEWQRYFSGQEYRRTCPTLPGLPLKSTR